MPQNIQTTIISSQAIVLKNLYGNGNGTIQLQCESDNVCSQLVKAINRNCNSTRDDTATCYDPTPAQPQISQCVLECAASIDENNSQYCDSSGAVTQNNCLGSTDKMLSDCAANQVNQLCQSSTPTSFWSTTNIIIIASVAGALVLLAALLYYKCRRERNTIQPADIEIVRPQHSPAPRSF